MTKSVVVVVDVDPSVHRAIASAAAADALEVVGCSTAAGGLNACLVLEPACLVTSLELPGHDGLWLIASVRRQERYMSTTPIIALVTEDGARMRALVGGADTAVTEPVGAATMVAQIQALVAMAARLRTSRRSSTGPRFSASSGELERTPVASVLGALELDGQSGELELSGPDRKRLVLSLASGAIVGGRHGGSVVASVDALRVALAWDGGKFEFTPGQEREPPFGSPSVGTLMLAALRPEEPVEEETPASKRAPLSAPGRRLVEITHPSTRPDPRVDDDRRPPSRRR